MNLNALPICVADSTSVNPVILPLTSLWIWTYRVTCVCTHPENVIAAIATTVAVMIRCRT